jgi:C_GCAxxG_C_C family probable redox protein
VNDAKIAQAKSQALARFTDTGPARINCSQAVLSFGLDVLGEDRDLEKVANYFGGGMASMGEVCGAITGALMAVGFRDYQRGAGAEQIAATKAALQTAMRDFAEEFGACRCRDLTGFDMSTPEGFQAFRASGTAERCQDYVGWMIDEIAPLLED